MVGNFNINSCKQTQALLYLLYLFILQLNEIISFNFKHMKKNSSNKLKNNVLIPLKPSQPLFYAPYLVL